MSSDPSSHPAADRPASALRFGEFLRQTRERANQTAEVMAILLSMEPDDYLAIEAGVRYPDDDTVRRLCMMMEWNYLETQRLIRNEMSSPGRLTAPPPAAARRGAGALASAGAAGAVSGARPDSLAERLKEVRQQTGQSADIIAALLHLTTDQYIRLEEGEMPGDDLLRRISMVYTWNFQELLSQLRAGQAHNLQPRLLGNPFPGTGQRLERLKGVCRELEGMFGGLPEAEQDIALAQLDLIRGTMARQRRPAAPAPPAQPAPPGTAGEPALGAVRRKHGPLLAPLSPEDRKLFS
jgi:transcriptional regulator with XRE-family HTH domain